MKTEQELLDFVKEVARTTFTGSKGQGFLGDLELTSEGTIEAGERVAKYYKEIIRKNPDRYGLKS
jgi:hypothetical protein